MLKVTSKTIPTCPPEGYDRIVARFAAAGLSRVLDHMWKGEFAIISASTSSNTPGENKQRTGTLKETVRSMGFGFIDIKGSYVYDNTNVPVVEDSIFVPQIPLSKALEIAKTFNQESIIYGSNGEWSEVSRDGFTKQKGAVEKDFEPLRQKKVGPDYGFLSQIRRNPNQQFRFDPSRQVSEDGGNRQVAASINNQYYFLSMSGDHRPSPPSGLRPFDIVKSGASKPDCMTLECFIPLTLDS